MRNDVNRGMTSGLLKQCIGAAPTGAAAVPHLGGEGDLDVASGVRRGTGPSGRADPTRDIDDRAGGDKDVRERDARLKKGVAN
jgi:hypothetical protein